MAIIDNLTDDDILHTYQAVCIMRSALNAISAHNLRPIDILPEKHHRVLAKLRLLIREANRDAGVSRIGMN